MADEPSEFDKLLDDLESAAAALFGATSSVASDSDVEFDLPVGGAGATNLGEEPKSLIAIPALASSHPISTFFTPPSLDDVEALGVGSIVDDKYEVLGGSEERQTRDLYRVRHVMLRQPFMLQLLGFELVDDPIIWPAFQADIKAVGMLGSENIEFVTDLGHCPRFGPYLVKLEVTGESLDELLDREGPQSMASAVSVAHTVGVALASLHEIGIVHGRLSGSTVRLVSTPTGTTWRLLDVCVPGRARAERVAPEQKRGEATGPETDQYAVAALVWKLLKGPGVPLLGDRAGITAELVSVLETALADHPLMRFPDMEAFLSALHEAADEVPQPSVHPFDRKEVSRQVRASAVVGETPVVGQAENAFEKRPASVRVSMRALGQRSGVTMEFATAQRLRREYRRNLLAGALFVPTTDMLTIGSTIEVGIRYAPQDRSVDVAATVVTHDPGAEDRPPGYGVVFDAPAKRELEQFLFGLQIGLGVKATDLIRVARALHASADFGAGEAFLLSRLTDGTPVGQARAMLSGLPFDFDDSLAGLLEAGYVQIESAAREAGPKAAPQLAPAAPVRQQTQGTVAPPPARSEPAAGSTAPAVERRPPAVAEERPKTSAHFEKAGWSDAEQVLRSVDFYQNQGNYLAAKRMLESAIENAPQVPAYHHRAALLAARFDVDLLAAREAIAVARRLDPRNEEFLASQRFISTLLEMAAISAVIERDVGRPTPRFVRIEPALSKLWLGRQTATRSELVLVDWQSRKLETTRGGPDAVIHATNSPDFAALENRKPFEFQSRAARHERQLKLAARFGGFGAHLGGPPQTVATSSNTTLRAVHKDDGLTLVRENGTEVRLSEVPARLVAFSPDDTHIAWVADKGGAATLWGCASLGTPTKLGAFSAVEQVEWDPSGRALYVLCADPPTLHAVDYRQGSHKAVLKMSGCRKGRFVMSSDGAAGILSTERIVGKSGWILKRIGLPGGEARGEFAIPAKPTALALRDDGMLAAVLKDHRLLLANLQTGSSKLLSTLNLVPASVERCPWPAREKLYGVELESGRLRVVGIDVDLLLG